MVRMGICVSPSGNRSNNRIMVRQPRKSQCGGVIENRGWLLEMVSDTSNRSSGTIVREVVFSYNLERLLKDLPKLDRLVICGQKEMGGVLSLAPFDLVDFFFNFERL